MIELFSIEYGDAAVNVDQELLHVAAFVVCHPFKIAIRHFLRHCPAVEVVGVHLHDVRDRQPRAVERAPQLVVGARVADACATDATLNIRLNNAIHFWVGDQRDRPVNVFEKRVPRELWRTHKVGRV